MISNGICFPRRVLTELSSLTDLMKGWSDVRKFGIEHWTLLWDLLSTLGLMLIRILCVSWSCFLSITYCFLTSLGTVPLGMDLMTFS